MNKDNAKDYLKLVQALADGKTIQVKSIGGAWADMIEVRFDGFLSDYRIKPELRECWVNIYDETIASTVHETKDAAIRSRGCEEKWETVKFREVIE